MKKISIFDTTLRGGSQGAGISFSVEDKLKIALALDDFGVSYIEGGWPGSNPKDEEFFKLAKNKLKNSKLVAFSSPRRKNIKAKDDAHDFYLWRSQIYREMGRVEEANIDDIKWKELKKS